MAMQKVRCLHGEALNWFVYVKSVLLARSPGKMVHSGYIYYHRMETISLNTKE